MSSYCKDFTLLYLTRFLRMFSYGMLAVIFFENLFNKGLTEQEASWIQSAIVAGDIGISLYLTTRADRLGRVNTLMAGALLKLLTGLAYAESTNVVVLTIAGILGVISVTGGEIGPFMPVEQSALSQLVEKSTENRGDTEKNITKMFGYYNLIGYLAQASGAAGAGIYINYVNNNCGTESDAITNLVRFYALLGGIMAVMYFFLNREVVEVEHAEDKKMVNCSGIEPQNFRTILTLSALFALDAFAGAFIVQSFLSFYYEQKYQKSFESIGFYLFVCNVVSGISGILSSKLVQCIGAMATMIYTHLPSNVFLLFIAFTNDATWSIIFLMARFCISQMDVPARQTFVTMIVSPGERSAANGITNIARSVGLAFGLGLNGYFMSMGSGTLGFSAPFIIAGGLKILYDITIGCCFLWAQKNKREQFQLGSMEVSEGQVTPSEQQHS